MTARRSECIDTTVCLGWKVWKTRVYVWKKEGRAEGRWWGRREVKFYWCNRTKSMNIGKHGKYRTSRRMERSRMAFQWNGAWRGCLTDLPQRGAYSAPNHLLQQGARIDDFCTGTRHRSEHSKVPSFPPVAGLSTFRNNAHWTHCIHLFKDIYTIYSLK